MKFESGVEILSKYFPAAAHPLCDLTFIGLPVEVLEGLSSGKKKTEKPSQKNKGFKHVQTAIFIGENGVLN